jgi:hypothetical protein
MFPTPLAANYATGGLVGLPPDPAPTLRAYSSTLGTALDVPGSMDTIASGDAAALINQGFVAIGMSGVTSARPPTGGLRPGFLYVDTTLSIVVVWDSANWRNVVTGAVA